MPCDLDQKIKNIKELLTTFQLRDNPVAQCMGCSPTYGHGTYTNAVKKDPPAAFWHSRAVLLCQCSSTVCIQAQVGQPQQQRRPSRLWQFWVTENHNRKHSNCWNAEPSQQALPATSCAMGLPPCCHPPKACCHLFHTPLPAAEMVGLVHALGTGFRAGTKWLLAGVNLDTLKK